MSSIFDKITALESLSCANIRGIGVVYGLPARTAPVIGFEGFSPMWLSGSPLGSDSTFAAKKSTERHAVRPMDHSRCLDIRLLQRIGLLADD